MQTKTYITYKTGTISITTVVDLVSLTLDRNSQQDKTKLKQRGTLLLACLSDWKLPPITTDNYKSQHGFQNVNKKCPPNKMLI
jgi:hypothetical protein